VATRPANEAGRPRGDRRSRTREVEHAQEAGKPDPGGEREAYAPPKLQTDPPGAPADTKKATDPAPALHESAPPSSGERDDATAPHRADQLAASLRAALAPEPEEGAAHDTDDEHDDSDKKPRRPDGLFFRSSSGEDATLSAAGGTQPELARATKPADEEQLAVIERTFAPASGGDELARTNEGTALEFLDATLARPPKLSEPPPQALGDTGENEVVSSEGHEASAARDGAEAIEEEVIIADDLAEMIEAEEGEPPPEEPKAKRSVPPPIPRH
jgi:hypothetical protein